MPRIVIWLLGGFGLFVVLTLAVAVFLPAIGAARRTSIRLRNDAAVAGLHKACVTYSAGNGGFYPGFRQDGDIAHTGRDVEARYKTLLDANLVTPNLIVSPLEQHPQYWKRGERVMGSHYSYAMLQAPDTGERRKEWAASGNPRAAIITDRRTTQGRGFNQWEASVHDPKQWKGSTAFNDGHVEFLTNRVLATNVYGNKTNSNDDVWVRTADDDAFFVNVGN